MSNNDVTTVLDECDLYIFNFIKPVLVNIVKDEHFLMTTLNKLEMFYFKYYLPTCDLQQINRKSLFNLSH